MQLELDFRLHHPEAVMRLVTDFGKWSAGIIAAARLSRRTDVVELLRDYDSQAHQQTQREITYAVLLLVHLLPSSNTRQKAKLSSAEMEGSLVAFKPQQTSIELFAEAKKNSCNKQPSLLCIGTRDEPGTFYLMLDAKAVCLGECGTLKAVDCLFKSHFVFWVTYGKPLSLFMEFLQKILYHIEPQKLSVRVRELKNSILALTESG